MPVLDQPVVLALVHSVPNNQDSVVKHDWIAGLLVIHSSLVQLERGLTGVNTHRDRTHTGHCFLKGQLVTSSYLDETSAGSPDFRRTKWAGFFLWTVHQALNRVELLFFIYVNFWSFIVMAVEYLMFIKNNCMRLKILTNLSKNFEDCHFLTDSRKGVIYAW